MRYTLAIVLSAALAAIVVLPTLVLAAGPGEGSYCPPGKTCLPNPLGETQTVRQLIEEIVTWLRDLGAPIAAVVIIYGAFQILTAGGDPEKFATGKKTILYAVIGYGIIFVGWGIVKIIERLLSV